ncbi:hypothetical protein E8E14_010687 [Neopestalotiopsis sp. 37M]|nr:hypothetical protein E8E14_010687 [Neopestalotiopsis sp. 37M]
MVPWLNGYSISMANQILNATAKHLSLPDAMIKNIRRNCIEVYDMTRPPSKNAAYRRWQEYGAPPILHDAVGMYAVGLGRFHPRFKEALRTYDQQWLIWSGGMRPALGPRQGNIHAHDAAIRPNGQPDAGSVNDGDAFTIDVQAKRTIDDIAAINGLRLGPELKPEPQDDSFQYTMSPMDMETSINAINIDPKSLVSWLICRFQTTITRLKFYCDYYQYHFKIPGGLDSFTETYGVSRLRHIRDRLNERIPFLFVEDSDTWISVRDVLSDGNIDKWNLFSDLAIQEWLGDIRPIESTAVFAVTKEDPRCRFIFLLLNFVTGPLTISTKSASRILSYHQVSPNFFDFLDVYGTHRALKRELRFSGFKAEIYLANPEPGVILPELGRSGRHYQISYNLKTATLREDIKQTIKQPGPGCSLWYIRQAAVHHQLDVGSGVQLWIFGDPYASLKGHIAEIMSEHRNHKDKFKSVSASFKSSLEIQLHLARWAMGGWRQYILTLEDAVEHLRSLLILRRDDRQSQLRTKELLDVQEHEDRINECIMSLESNEDNMTLLSKFYGSIFQHKDFPSPERQSCEQHVKHFASQLWELIYDAKMHIRRVKVLTKIMGDRKATLVQLLQAQAAERAEQVSTTMWRQAEQTSHEAIAMRIITVITLLYLPPTFVSTLFSTDIVKYQGDDGDLNHDIFSSLALQRFLEISLPLMLLTFTVVFGW